MIDYDKISVEYARHRTALQVVLDELIRTSDINSSSNVLEIGSGTGNYIHAIREQIKCHCWGVDPSEKMLAQAKESEDGVLLQYGSAENLGFPDARYDLVFSVDVIHHIQDRFAHYKEAFRVLRPGGRVATVTDSDWIIKHRKPLSEYFPETVNHELKRYPSIPDLWAEMMSAGFEEITEKQVELKYKLTDIRPYREKAFTSLHLIPDRAFNAGIKRMEQDLEKGPIDCKAMYLILWCVRPA